MPASRLQRPFLFYPDVSPSPTLLPRSQRALLLSRPLSASHPFFLPGDPASAIASLFQNLPVISNASHSTVPSPWHLISNDPQPPDLRRTPKPRITAQFPASRPLIGPNPESSRRAQTKATRSGGLSVPDPTSSLHVDPPSSRPQRELAPVTMATPVRTPAALVPRRLGGSRSARCWGTQG